MPMLLDECTVRPNPADSKRTECVSGLNHDRLRPDDRTSSIDSDEGREHQRKGPRDDG